jgi:hypothetical protein
MARSNAAQWGTHIHRRNRKRSDGAGTDVRAIAAAIGALLAWSSFNSVGRIPVWLDLFPLAKPEQERGSD